MDVVSEIIQNKQQDKSGIELTDAIRDRLNEVLLTMSRKCGDIAGCMLCSVDGLAWAEQLQPELDQNRFAAMSSALLALSDNLGREASNGTIRKVLIEAEAGSVFVMHAGHRLVLTVFTRAGANLGLPLAHANRAIEDIGSILGDAGQSTAENPGQ